eukprot:798756-Amphidinium_carterae.2
MACLLEGQPCFGSCLDPDEPTVPRLRSMQLGLHRMPLWHDAQILDFMVPEPALPKSTHPPYQSSITSIVIAREVEGEGSVESSSCPTGCEMPSRRTLKSA